VSWTPLPSVFCVPFFPSFQSLNEYDDVFSLLSGFLRAKDDSLRGNLKWGASGTRVMEHERLGRTSERRVDPVEHVGGGYCCRRRERPSRRKHPLPKLGLVYVHFLHIHRKTVGDLGVGRHRHSPRRRRASHRDLLSPGLPRLQPPGARDFFRLASEIVSGPSGRLLQRTFFLSKKGSLQ